MEELFMTRCLELANIGAGQVAPNPLVGCVIVHDGKVIGEGYHQGFGEAHAEVNAIASVSERSLLLTSTLYVNLEPCTHIGKTPACSDLILKSHIPHVVIGIADTNDQVSGGGAVHLEERGVQVKVGMMEKECREINKRFFTFHREKRPYIILKWAESKNGFIAPTDKIQRWITGEDSKRLVHKWRTEEQAIMVGTNTAIVDDPSLTARLWKGSNPVRITIDNKGRIPAKSNMFNADADTIVYGSQKKDQESNVEFVFLEEGPNQLQELLADLYAKDMLSIIVEGGQQLLNSFIQLGLWDEARVFTGPGDFSEGLRAPDLGIDHVDEEDLGQDRLRLYLNKT